MLNSLNFVINLATSVSNFWNPWIIAFSFESVDTCHKSVMIDLERRYRCVLDSDLISVVFTS